MNDTDGSSSFLHKHMLLIALAIGIVAMIVGLFFTKKTFAPGTETVPYENPNDSVPAATNDPQFCSSLEGPALQTCCNNWARDNNISIMTCTGEWLLQNGVCTYSCASLPTAP